MFEDSMVEKEVNIRKRILRDFNKKEEDFPTLREYNDYLEEIETIIYNLANNIDVIEMNKKIEQYKKDNREQIAKSKSKLDRTGEAERGGKEDRTCEGRGRDKEEKDSREGSSD